MSWIFVADDGERVHYDVPPQVAELESEVAKLNAELEICDCDALCEAMCELEAKLANREAAVASARASEDKLFAKVERLEAAEAKLERTCNWSCDSDGLWQTECLEEWHFHDGTPKECGVKFCPNCGGKAEFKEGEQDG